MPTSPKSLGNMIQNMSAPVSITAREMAHSNKAIEKDLERGLLTGMSKVKGH